MLQFIPFDDRWFDADPTMLGPLVPYHAGIACAHAPAEGAPNHSVAGGTFTKVAISPSRIPSCPASPPFNSST